MKTVIRAFFVLLLLVPVTGVAQNIEVPVGSQAKEKWSVDRPTAGMLKSQVESLYGRPQSTKAPVGDPPISSWTYADFVVYFEYDHVVHTVLRTTAQAGTAVSTAGDE